MWKLPVSLRQVWNFQINLTRAHTLKKEDGHLLDTLFAAERYIALCRERWQEMEIRRTWQRNQNSEGTEPLEGGTHL